MSALTPLSEAWAAWMPAVAWQAAVLGVVVWLLDALLRRLGAPRARLALWWLVAAKFVLPPTLGATVPAAATLAHDIAPSPAATGSFALPLAGLWALGLLFILVRGARRRLRFGATLRQHAMPAPAWAEQLTREVAARLRLRRAPRLAVLPGLSSPAVTGLVHPRVLLGVLPPRADAGAHRRLEHVLLHELAHLRRRDLHAQALFGVLRAVYWFHPLAWIAARRTEALREIACDLHVAAHLRGDVQAYRQTLLDAAAARLLPGGPAPVGARFFREGSMILARLRALEGCAWRHAGTKRIASLAAAGLLGALLVPMAASPAVHAASPQALRDAEALLARTLAERETFGCLHRRAAFHHLLALEESHR